MGNAPVARLVKAAVLYTVSYVGSNPTGSTNLDFPSQNYYFRRMEIETTYVPCLHKEFKNTSPQDIEKMYSEAIDRWTWETGSDEDWALVQQLDAERHYRKNYKPRKLSANWTVEAQQDIEVVVGEGVEEEMVAAISEEILQDIKKRALESLK